MTTLIGWLSLCILVAGWSSLLVGDNVIRWKHVGLFGLVAAYGLETSHRFKIAHAARQVRRAIEATLRRSRFVSTDRIALKNFCAELERRTVRRVPVRERGGQLMPPVLITPFEDGTEGKTAIQAFVRDLSEFGIGLRLDRRLATGFGNLRVDWPGEDTTSVLVRIRWSKEVGPDDYHCGCEFIGSEPFPSQPFVRLSQWCFK